MKLGVLFSGGKDSTLATWIAKKKGHEISCLISIFSENKDSYMFHTPSISKVKSQAKVMELPLIIKNSLGNKEEELKDLEKVILEAKERYCIKGIVTGAVKSVYQATRIQKICDELSLECFNPLWQRNSFELLKDLIKNKFEVIIVGVAAYPLGKEFLGKKINEEFILEVRKLNEKFKISPVGEGGEFESFVLNCPLFKEGLEIKSYEDFGMGNSWRREIILK